MTGKFKPASQTALISRAALRRQGLDEDQRVAILKTSTAALENKADFIAEIGRLWQDAQKRFLTIGRYLNAAKERLPHGEFEAMIASELPFGRQTAFYLRSAATAIDEGRFLEEEVPPSYATVYQLATLDERELSLARERGIVRPNVTREEVLRFKRELKAAPARPPEDGRPGALRRRRERILADIERLKAELAAIDRELTMEPGPGGTTIDGTAVEVESV